MSYKKTMETKVYEATSYWGLKREEPSLHNNKEIGGEIKKKVAKRRRGGSSFSHILRSLTTPHPPFGE